MARTDKLDAGGMRAMVRSYRTELHMMSHHVRRLEAELVVLGKENDQLRMVSCGAGCSCRGCAAESRARAAEAMLAEMVAMHDALLENICGQASDRARCYLRRSGLAVYHV